MKRRDIICVWKGTNETAGEGACRKRSYPEAVTTCHKDSLKLECKDKENLNSPQSNSSELTKIVSNKSGGSLHSGIYIFNK